MISGVIAAIAAAAILSAAAALFWDDSREIRRKYDVEVESGGGYRLGDRLYRYRWHMYCGKDPIPVDARYIRTRLGLTVSLWAAFLRRWWEE